MKNEKKDEMGEDKGGWEVLIYSLENCEICHDLTSKLTSESIKFREINISNFSLLGDRIESIYKCYKYPILILDNSKTNIQEVYLPETSLLPTPHINNYYSITGLINNIKQILKQ